MWDLAVIKTLKFCCKQERKSSFSIFTVDKPRENIHELWGEEKKSLDMKNLSNRKNDEGLQPEEGPPG